MKKIITKSDKIKDLHDAVMFYGIGQFIGWWIFFLGAIYDFKVIGFIGLSVTLIFSFGWTIAMWRLARMKNRSVITWVLGINLINIFGIAQLVATFSMVKKVEL